MAFSSQSLLLERAVWPSREYGSVHPLLFAARIILGMQKAFSNKCGMNLDLAINLKNLNLFVSENVKYFNPDHLYFQFIYLRFFYYSFNSL